MSSLYDAVKGSMRGMPMEVSRDVREASFFFDADFAGFDGHFPDSPLVPGVAQIMAAVLTAAPEGAARLRSIGRSKFLRKILPGDTMKVRTSTKSTGGGLRVLAECVTQNGPCAQLHFVLDQ